MLTIPEMVAAISKRAEGRYEVFMPEMFELASPSIDFDSAILQLKRVNREGAGWRTVLIAAFPFDLVTVQSAFRWAADVRDMLAEPETADLYMFILIDGIASEDAARFETDDRFCRKIVVRDQESLESFLDRTFLATLSPSGSSENITDPVLASLNALSLELPWVKPHLETWRELLLSGKSSTDIADALKFATFGNEDSQ